jgi:hypothetical protein
MVQIKVNNSERTFCVTDEYAWLASQGSYWEVKSRHSWSTGSIEGRVRIKGEPKRVVIKRLIMEYELAKQGKSLSDTLNVHIKDGDEYNLVPDNLELRTKEESNRLKTRPHYDNSSGEQYIYPESKKQPDFYRVERELYGAKIILGRKIADLDTAIGIRGRAQVAYKGDERYPWKNSPLIPAHEAKIKYRDFLSLADQVRTLVVQGRIADTAYKVFGNVLVIRMRDDLCYLVRLGEKSISFSTKKSDYQNAHNTLIEAHKERDLEQIAQRMRALIAKAP